MNKKEYTKKDFTWLNMSESEILAFPKTAYQNIKEKVKLIQKIKKENRNFENTVLAYELCNMDEAILFSKISTLSLMHTEKKIRDAARKAEEEFSNYITEVSYDIKTFHAISDYYNFNYINEKKNLDYEDIKLTEDIYTNLKRMGFDLEKEKRDSIKQIKKKINSLANKYDARLAENSDHILCSELEVAGIPENIVNSFEKVEKNKKTFYKITLDYPIYGPFMKYANSREKRKELYTKFNNAGGKENIRILDELITLRAQKAKILNYDSHAEYILEKRMAKNVDNVYKMLDSINKKYSKLKDEELKLVKEEAKKLSINDVKNYDLSYILNKIKEDKYEYDEQEVREYFPLDNVLNSMFKMFGDLFSFTVNKTNIKTFHKDVNIYELREKNGNIISYLMLDLFPREGKFGHACMMPTLEGHKRFENINQNKKEDFYSTPVATVICNFPQPQKNTPSLLSVGEVETIFHEFGHALHCMLTEAKYSSHSGTSVVWDFVEVPSQLLEEWLYDEKVLNKISCHYKTGKKLSKKYISKILALKDFMKGNFYKRQEMLCLIDMNVYTGKSNDARKIYHDIMENNFIKEDEDILFVSRFAHIARGYDAGYYSYMWSELICKDIYSEFKKAGIFNKTLGKKYRNEILKVGGSREEEKSVKSFLGRNINWKA